MGEDAELDTSDDERSLSPTDDTTVKHEEWQDGWICSIDGSYAVNTAKSRDKQEELLPWYEYSSVQQIPVLPRTCKDSLTMMSGVLLDDSRPLPARVSKKLESTCHTNDSPSIVRLPQSLEIPMKQERLHNNTSSNHQANGIRLRKDISPIRCDSNDGGSARLSSRMAKIYDPLRQVTKQARISTDDRFSSELQTQADKLMNGLKAILNEKISKAKRGQSSSSVDTVTTALSCTGSASTVSTGRDVLTKEVRRLENAVHGMNLRVEADRARAGGDSSPPLEGNDNTHDTFNMPDMIPQERPCSSSHGASILEQARLSSRGSVQALTENAIRDAEDSSRVLRRLHGASCHLSTNLLREQATNTTKDPVRHVVITHRVKHAGCCFGGSRVHSDSCMPQYRHFKLRPITDKDEEGLGVDSVLHTDKYLPKHKTELECKAMLPITTGSERERGGQRDDVPSRKTGGGKRGRPIVTGRTYGRGRVRFRPMARHYEPSERKNARTLSSAVRIPCDLQDAATSTVEEQIQASVEANSDVISKYEDDRDVDVDDHSLPEKPKPKPVIHQKVPFVGSGLKCSNTFSVTGNQQQVMKIVSIRFQEWLPLVRNIIYDSKCKDYAQALLRDLSRQKRSNLEQIRLLERDIENCKVDLDRLEIRADITRLKQQWTRKHERVLKCLSEQISKGGVHSKVQQLRTIYAACAS